MYEWLPNFFTMIFFPISESVFEHTKMIFTSYMIWIIVKYYILKKYNLHENNFLFKELLTTFFNIILFLAVFVPIYRKYGENIFITLFIYFITIIISQIFNYFVKFKNDYKYLKILSTIVILLTYIISTYFAYKPPINWFFIDSKNNSYGLNK